MAITMMVLLGTIGLGLDSSYWYWQGWREQQAADQAALAGAVFLPDRTDLAVSVGTQSATQNGYNNPEITIGTGKNANQITVAIRKTHPSFFMRLFGKSSQEIVRKSVAEYIAPLTLGSPFPRAGNDPEDVSGTNLNYWLSQHGPWVMKHQGDRFAADNCLADATVAHPTPYGCSAGTATRGLSSDYQRTGQYGYRYAVDVDAVNSGKDLIFEVFDGVTSNVGNTCTNGTLPSPAERAALAAYVGDADTRYRSGSEPGGLAWCPSDQVNISTDAARNTQYMDTEFAVYSQERSVASGALVQNTVPPTTAAPASTTTLGPGGGGTVSSPCSAPTTPATLNITNTRATALKVYLVNSSCLEVLSSTIAPGGTGAFATQTGNRYRMYDGTTLELVSDYTVPVNTNPTTNKYARRSLEPAAYRNNWVSATGAISSTPVASASPIAYTWEVVPALNAVAGCNSFKTIDGTDRYLTFTGAGSAAAMLVDDTTPARRTAASWCSGPSAAVSGATTFSAYGQANTFLWRNPSTGTVGAQTLAAAANGTLDWFVNLPFSPQVGEPVPTGMWAELGLESTLQCVQPLTDTENSGVNQLGCNGGSTQNFQLQPDGRVLHQSSGRYLRPSGGNLTIGVLTGVPNEQWTASVLAGGLLNLTSNTLGGSLTNQCDPTPSAVIMQATGQPAACVALRLRLRDFIWPILVSTGPPAPLVVNLSTHINATGTCPNGGGAATLTVNNSRATVLGVYAMEAGCTERYLGPVPANGTATFSGVGTSQRVRVYASSTAAADFTIGGATHTATIPSTGIGTPCTASTGAAANVTFTNLRAAPVRLIYVDNACNQQNFGDVATNNSSTMNTFVGHVWQVVDTYSGRVLRTVTVTGAQTYAESPDILTGGACSSNGGSGANLTIINQRTSSLELRRVEPDCRVVVDRTLAAGSTTVIPSYDGQRWKVYNIAGEVVQDISVTSDETITISEPSTYTWDPNAGNTSGTTLICSRIETTYPLSSYSGLDQHSGKVTQLINPYDGVHDNGAGVRDPYAEAFTLGFRRWRTFCRVPAAEVKTGRYTLTVRTSGAGLNNEAAGNNSFSLRAAWLDSAGARSYSNLRLSALENLPVFINLGGASSSTVYLTRLQSVHAGRTLRVELFDIGDTASGTVNVQIMPPAESGMASWGCSMKLVSADGVFTPPSSNATNCSVSGLTRYNYNGAAIRFDIPIPATYTCDSSSATNCWTKVSMSFSGGQPTDRTTWSATVLGDPLRLVK